MSTGLEEELKERLHIKTLEKMSGSSGCISTGTCYLTDKGEKIFVKANGGPNAIVMLTGESESLKHILATKTIRAPKPNLVIHNYDDTHCSALVVEYVDMKALTTEGAKNLGRNLANLHDYNNKLIKYNKKAATWVGGVRPSVKPIVEKKLEALRREANSDDEDRQSGKKEEESYKFSKHFTRSQGTSSQQEEQTDEIRVEVFVPEPDTEQIDQFGFHVPTSCGSIPQVNQWSDEWVPFYARNRLDKAIRSILSDHGDRKLSEVWSRLQLKIHRFFTDYDHREKDFIVPALLHGDLWSGNVAELKSNPEPVIYDPSSFYGHSEYELGIVRMFGGIPSSFERSYFEILPKRKLFDKRNKLYQLFHHLNHWDHFGSGYRSSTLSLIEEVDRIA